MAPPPRAYCRTRSADSDPPPGGTLNPGAARPMEAEMSTGSRVDRAASIRDVARIAGVSHQTVSRVLNNSVSIRDETRDRVLAAMAELQYRPSAAARALSTSRTKTIGVL